MWSDRRRRVVRRLAERICPPDSATLALLDRIVDHTEATAASMTPLARRVLLVALELQGLGLASGTRLGRSGRDVVVLAYFDQPEVKARLGYDPDSWTAALAARRAARWGEAIDAHAAVVLAPSPPPSLGR